MESESPNSPDTEEHAEEFADVLDDLMDDVHERISSGRIPTPVISDSDSSEFVDIIDENTIGTNYPEPVENVLTDIDPAMFQEPSDESEGGFWDSPIGNLVIFVVIIIWFLSW